MKPDNFTFAADTMREAGNKIAALLQAAPFNSQADKAATIQDIADRVRDIAEFLSWLKQPLFD